MADFKPQPSVEILAARLVNEIVKNPDNFSDESIAGTTEASLVADYSDRDNLPNEQAELSMRGQDSNVAAIQEELRGLGVYDSAVDFTVPFQIKDFLDRFVERQEELKRRMATTIADYMESGKRDTLLSIGPSGSGKTYAWEITAKELGIPFVIKNLNSVTASGYEGDSLSKGLEELVGAERGILFIDEIDKAARGASGISKGAFEELLQNELLPYFDGKMIRVDVVSRQSGNGTSVPRKTAVIYGPGAGYYSSDATMSEIASRLREYVDGIRAVFREQGIEVDYVDYRDTFRGTPKKVQAHVKKTNPDDLLQEFERRLRGSISRSSAGDIDFGRLFCVQYGEDIVTSPNEANLRELLEKGTGVNGTPEGYIDMSKVLVVAAGAFHGTNDMPSIYSIVQKRLGGKLGRVDQTELLRHVTDQDLVEYGFKPELVRRMPIRAALEPIDVDDLYRILKHKENSVLDRIKKQFQEYGITLVFSDPVTLYLAEKAHEGIGVGGLNRVLADALEDISFNRDRYAGRTFNLSVSRLKEKLEREVKFERVDEYQVDWGDIRSIIGYLDLFVPGQEAVKVELATSFHLYHVKMNHPDSDIPTPNVLIAGPSGSGKNFMIELLANKAELPIAKTKLIGKVPQGYEGEKFLDVYDQFSQSQKYGIVFLDESDKVILNAHDPLNKELIMALEEGEVRGRSTGNYMHILAGAFQDVYNSGEVVNEEILARMGVEQEILGRVPRIVNISAPDLENMVNVLKGPRSELRKYESYFSTQGIKLEVEEDAYGVIAEHALQSKSGYRAFQGTCRELFNHYMTRREQYVGEDNVLRVTAQQVKEVLFKG